MAGESGHETHPLIEQLREGGASPHEFDFFQAVRRLECACAHLPRIGKAHRAADEPVRFGQLPSLAFAPTTLSRIMEASGTIPPRVLVNFLGVLGPNGALPLHITEYIRDREMNEDDPTLARFLDIFHHRAISLFYRAWADAQQTISHQWAVGGGGVGGRGRPEDDRYSIYIGSLFGAGMESLRGRGSGGGGGAVSDTAKLFFAGRLAGQTRNAEGLAAIIGDYFNIPTTLEQFVGQWLELDDSRRLRLGRSRATGTLGSTAIVGGRIWDRQQKFRLHLGPMDFETYQRMLPGGTSLEKLVSWVRTYIGHEYLFDVRLSLRAQCVPRTRLGQLGQLGWSTWIASRPLDRVVDDLILSPCAA